MKKLVLTPVLAFLLVISGALSAQNRSEEYLGLPGDNLNLFAVMTLFQDSETLEDFERGLNNPENMINNLDLNGDNLVDYIMVFDYVEDNVHAIVLRVALNSREFQDVAVFTVERLRNGAVRVQLIGDEALYGPNYIIEPNYAERANPGYRGNVVQQQAAPAPATRVVHTTYYDVAAWPMVVYISRPAYRPWRSAWYWGYHPTYWQPWTPHYYHYYYGYHYSWNTYYHTYYRPWHTPRYARYNTVYVTRIRNYSPTVVVNVNKGVYRSTYSRPEQRKEGEVLYTQRRATGTTVPHRRTAVGSEESVSRSRTATESNTRAVRTDNPSGNNTVSSPRAAAAPARTQTAPARERSQTTAPSVQRPATKTDRSASPPARTQTAPARERSQTTAPSVQRPATNSNRSASPPARTQTAPARERSQTTAPSVQRPATNSNRSATRTAPARKSDQPASSARPSSNRSRRN